MYAALAGLTAVAHGILVCCVVVGSLAAVCGGLRRRPRIAAGFYSVLFLIIASDRLLGDCVLTRLEQALRDAARPGSAYHGSFIGHYFGFLPPPVHQWIGPSLVLAALLAYPAWRVMDSRRAPTIPRSL